MPPGNKFAIPEDRALPGTIDVRRAPPAVHGGGRSRPDVICLFGQFEMGKPGAYARVSPMPPGGDTKAARERWFAQGLAAIGRLEEGR